MRSTPDSAAIWQFFPARVTIGEQIGCLLYEMSSGRQRIERGWHFEWLIRRSKNEP